METTTETASSTADAGSATASTDPVEYEVLIAGAVDWDNIGNKASESKKVLLTPHLLVPLSGKKIVSVFSGSSSCHAFFVTDKGEVYGIGRNKTGQLGIGNLNTQEVPHLVKGLKGHKIVQVACGKYHSLFLSSEGKVFATGDNKSGQCGQSNLKIFTTPVLVNIKHHIGSIACGLDFSLLLTKDTGIILSFGNPQYGQLGHGTDAQYLEKANKVVYVPQPEPREIRALSGKKIVEIATGVNHSLARSDAGIVYSWGFGGYGRLGFKDQKDKFVPTEIPDFVGRQVGMRSVRIFAGADVSFSLGASGQTYCFGKYKQTGDSYMYPKPVADLMGWKIREINIGNTSVVVLADNSVIVWKGSIGELGLGEQKSSSNPRKNDILEGLPVVKAACSYCTTFWLVKTGPHIAKLAKYDPGSAVTSVDDTAASSSTADDDVEEDPEDAEEDEEEEEEEEEEKAPKKRGRGRGKAPAQKKPVAKKAKK